MGGLFGKMLCELINMLGNSAAQGVRDVQNLWQVGDGKQADMPLQPGRP